MTLPTLPVPELQETLSRYLDWVRPLMSEADFANTQKITADFQQQAGKTLQQRLQRFAEQQNAMGESWLSEAWLAAYLSVRESLPLATSGAFRLDLDLPETGLSRLAALMVGLAQQSADYLNGELAVHTSPRGEPLDMGQWLTLRGIGRVPMPNCDRYELAPMSKQPRYAIVFWHGVAYRVPLLDENHQPYRVADITTLLGDIRRQTAVADADITALSLAPAEQAHVVRNALSQQPENAANFQCLDHSLFHVHLSDTAFADDTEALQALTFLPKTQLWAYKPFTLCANLENDDYYAHLEHSSFDAGALQAIFGRAEQAAQQMLGGSVNARGLSPTPLHWSINDEQKQQLATIRQQHAKQAIAYQVDVVTTTMQPSVLPERTSMDCLLQLVIQYAQLATFGHISNTYESVDVSHFQAGRTECIRPVSVESVAFVQALMNGTATLDGFNVAHTEHKNRIKACKSGHGVNRHLLGLSLMVNSDEKQPDFFDDVGYRTLTQDVLSTSSLGDRRLVGDFAFKPTVADGLGISYFITDDQSGFLFCLSSSVEQRGTVSDFAQALHDGTAALMRVFSAE